MKSIKSLQKNTVFHDVYSSTKFNKTFSIIDNLYLSSAHDNWRVVFLSEGIFLPQCHFSLLGIVQNEVRKWLSVGLTFGKKSNI